MLTQTEDDFFAIITKRRFIEKEPKLEGGFKLEQRGVFLGQHKEKRFILESSIK